MAAMFSIEITGRIYCSHSPLLKSRIVSGTKIISETSFVTNIEVKNTPKIRNSESAVVVPSPDARFSTGRRTFSFLKPSRMQSIIKRVPRVRQSIPARKSALGGVIISPAAAARSDTVSIKSFFKKSRAFFMVKSSGKIICDIGKNRLYLPRVYAKL